MNNETDFHSQHIVDDDVALPSGDGSFKGMPKELKMLVTETVARLKDEAYRNGRKATAHKEQQRSEYAATIWATEGRAVRSYQHHKTEEERKAARRKQKAASKANRSPDQIAREKEADRLRKQGNVEGRRETARQTLEAAPDFGKF